MGIECLDVVAGGLDDLGDVGDAATSGGDGHCLAGLDGLAQVEAGKLAGDFVGDVGYSRRFERLLKTDHAWKLHCGLSEVGRAVDELPSPWPVVLT